MHTFEQADIAMNIERSRRLTAALAQHPEGRRLELVWGSVLGLYNLGNRVTI
jgi:hypothetical protein